MCAQTNVLRHVVGETKRRGAITCTYVYDHCKLVSVEDLLWWVSTNHRERLKNNSMGGWWCGACGQPYDFIKSDRLLTLQFGDTTNEQVVFLAHGAPDGECDNMISAVKLITKHDKG